MKVKRLKDNEYRVIRIKGDAIREFVCETIMEKGKDFFDILDVTKISFEINFDMNKGDLICVVHNRTYPLNEVMDFEQIANIVDKTTDTMFSPNRYITLIKQDGVYKRK